MGYACFHHSFLPLLTFCHVLMVACLKDVPALKDLYHVDVITAINCVFHMPPRLELCLFSSMCQSCVQSQ